MVWALTGSFSDDEQSKQSAVLVEADLKDIKQRAESETNEKEKNYIMNAMHVINSSLRSLETAFKGRQLNFEENEKLRSASLDSIKESLEFGKKAKDFLKSLPSMTIGAAGGVTVAAHYGLKDIRLWGIGLILAGIGYFVNLIIVRYTRKQKQMYYILQDYERSLYYENYITRVSLILTFLYLDLDRIHKTVFGQTYPTKPDTSDQMIKDLLSGVRPTFCPFIHKHIIEKKISPELWSQCETGNPVGIRACLFWEGKK